MLQDGRPVEDVNNPRYMPGDGFGLALEAIGDDFTGLIVAIMDVDPLKIAVKFDVERAKQIRDRLSLLITAAELTVTDAEKLNTDG